MEEKSRRSFLKKGLMGTGALAAGCGMSEGDHNQKDEKVEVLGVNGEVMEVSQSDMHDHAAMINPNIDPREGIEGRRFVMVVDLGKCKNARKCVTACQKMHYTPDKEWLKVKLMKDNEDAAPYWFPKMCFHCDDPPCVKVCPVDATYKRTDGLVLIDNERCIGCKFCMAGCPYSTRVFNWGEPEQPEHIADMEHSPETSLPREHSTVEKCDFCPDMVRAGQLPDCVTACPNGVFYFGDENEDAVTNGSETVRLSTLLKDKAGYRFQEELGTKPRLWYLPPSSRMFPVERGIDDAPEGLQDDFREIIEGD